MVWGIYQLCGTQNFPKFGEQQGDTNLLYRGIVDRSEEACLLSYDSNDGGVHSRFLHSWKVVDFFPASQGFKSKKVIYP